eukprot:TRINITY_DN1324_c1_g1_i2.p2 TRINITY_DN1324_c1_g1~~TRINITY_DN1324_c1_g1_i2.p2  ORF type:complete len:182 (+),score=32.58 TRINITY_DN1324_c1_g1_i2:441-986(+)
MKLGEILELNIVDNVCEHLLGNVYVKFATEEDAENAHKNLTGRFYGGRMLMPEYVPVTDFHESSCRQYEENECERGGLCNFMHLKGVSKKLLRDLFSEQKKLYKDRRRERKRKERAEGRAPSEEDVRDREPRHEEPEDDDEPVFGMGRAVAPAKRDRETSEERRGRLREAYEKKHGKRQWV